MAAIAGQKPDVSAEEEEVIGVKAVLLGPPGAGKGMQVLLVDISGISYIYVQM